LELIQICSAHDHLNYSYLSILSDLANWLMDLVYIKIQLPATRPTTEVAGISQGISWWVNWHNLFLSSVIFIFSPSAPKYPVEWWENLYLTDTHSNGTCVCHAPAMALSSKYSIQQNVRYWIQHCTQFSNLLQQMGRSGK
jgi:hypothetical protein